MDDPQHAFAYRPAPPGSPGRPELRGVRSSPPRALTDAELVRLAQEPPTVQAAAAEILRRYHPLVLRILRRSLGRKEEAYDLAQEVFLRLFTRIHALRDGQALKAFVTTVTVNVFRRELRRRRLRSLFGFERPIDDAEPVSPGTPDEDAREAFARLHRILTGLPPRDRLLFSLRWVEEMPVEDVALATTTPERTVKRHLARIWLRVVTLATRDESLAGYVAKLKGHGDHRAPGGGR